LVDYVSPPQLVAHEKCFEGSTMLHGQCALKVMVETICYGDATEPIPTLEVGILSQVVRTFISGRNIP